jgi:signal transduction histidine kinase
MVKLWRAEPPGRERRALRRALYGGAAGVGALWTALALAAAPATVFVPVLVTAAALALLIAETRTSEQLAQALALAWLAVLVVALPAAGSSTAPAVTPLALGVGALLLNPLFFLPLFLGTLLLPPAFPVPLPASLPPLLANLATAWLLAHIDGANRRVERLAVAQSRMVDTIGHELRTPLTEIKVLMDLLVRVLPSGLPGEQLQRMVPMLIDMRRHCDELAGMVDRAQWYQRLAAGQAALGTAETDVAALVREVTGEAGPRARAREVRLELDVPGRLPVPVNARALRRAVEALVDNAVKFTPAGGRARIGCAQRRGRAEIWVCDDGPGIRPEDLPYVCEPFFHREYLIDAGDSQRGIGLGLPIARQIVEAHGGELSIESEPGQGTRVVLSLPQQAAW